MPLTQLTKKNVKFVWSPECEENFKELKRRLVTDHPPPTKAIAHPSRRPEDVAPQPASTIFGRASAHVVSKDGISVDPSKVGVVS